MLKSMLWTRSEPTFNTNGGGALSLTLPQLGESERLSPGRNGKMKKMTKKRIRGRESPLSKRAPLIPPFKSIFSKPSNIGNYRLKTKKSSHFNIVSMLTTLTLKKSTWKKLYSSFMPQPVPVPSTSKPCLLFILLDF